MNPVLSLCTPDLKKRFYHYFSGENLLFAVPLPTLTTFRLVQLPTGSPTLSSNDFSCANGSREHRVCQNEKKKAALVNLVKSHILIKRRLIKENLSTNR